MLDDIISKFSENKKLDKFEFSLRPNHDIDNPFTNISLNIIGNLKQSIDKTDFGLLKNELIYTTIKLLMLLYTITYDLTI